MGTQKGPILTRGQIVALAVALFALASYWALFGGKDDPASPPVAQAEPEPVVMQILREQRDRSVQFQEQLKPLLTASPARISDASALLELRIGELEAAAESARHDSRLLSSDRETLIKTYAQEREIIAQQLGNLGIAAVSY